jgi:two-component system, sensor histidine kinase and response regulator
MTANTMVGDRQKALEAGMNDHLGKPIDPEELAAVLMRWLRPAADSTSGLRLSEVRRASPPPPARQSGLPVLHCLDVAKGLKHLAGNQELYLSLLARYRDNYAGIAEDLQQFLSQADHETARRLAHTIKALAGNLGAADLSEAAGQLETSIGVAPEREVSALLARFAACHEAVIAELRLAMPQVEASPPPSPVKVDPGTVAPLLEALERLLDDDFMAAMEQFQKLQQALAGSTCQPVLIRLAKSLEDFDTASAVTHLRALEAHLELPAREATS